MKRSRRQFLRLATAAPALAMTAGIAGAQTYPMRPIRLIIGFPPGSALDTISRIIGRWMSDHLGQPVIIESKPGAATNISIQAAIASAPDGYTLVVVSASNAINAALLERLPFDYLRDLAPVCGLTRPPMVMIVNPSVPAHTVAEFIALAKANPGRLAMASFGTSTASHLAGALFMSMTGTNLLHVPYRGSPPAHVDLISREVQVMFDTMTAALPHIKSGAFRPLAVVDDVRFSLLPDVPLLRDTLPAYDVKTWNGLAAPRGTPADITDRIYRVVTAGLADAAVRAQLADVAAVPMPMAPGDFAAFMAGETAKWAGVVKLSDVRPD